MTARYDFASDNVSGAMPEALDALVAANDGLMPAYGTDPVTAEAADLIRAYLDADAEIRFFASGTAANSLALPCLAAPHEAVLAHEHAHILTDETGAPGFFGGGMGLIGLGGKSGRIDVQALSAALEAPETARRQPPAALSLTIATEYGTLYPEHELASLITLAKSRGLGIHVDGARLAHAVAAGFDPKSLARLGVDILVMGGTKAGGTPTEAVVFFNTRYVRRLDMRIKHAGQLISKGRYLAAPWIGMLSGSSPAWVARASHANAMARGLAAQMPFPRSHKVETNGVFVEMDEIRLQRLTALGWQVFRSLDGSVRFMCSWATTREAVDELSAALASL